MEDTPTPDESAEPKRTPSIDIPQTQPSLSQPSSDPSTPPNQIRTSFSARRPFGPRTLLDRSSLSSSPASFHSAFSPHSAHATQPSSRDSPLAPRGIVDTVFRPSHATIFPDNHTVYDYWHAVMPTPMELQMPLQNPTAASSTIRSATSPPVSSITLSVAQASSPVNDSELDLDLHLRPLSNPASRSSSQLNLAVQVTSPPAYSPLSDVLPAGSPLTPPSRFQRMNLGDSDLDDSDGSSEDSDSEENDIARNHYSDTLFFSPQPMYTPEKSYLHLSNNRQSHVHTRRIPYFHLTSSFRECGHLQRYRGYQLPQFHRTYLKKRMQLVHMPRPADSQINKVFASTWISPRCVLFGSKNNQVVIDKKYMKHML